MATDDDIEREIQAKGLTAPRVTPESIEAKIKSEWYFTAAHGVEGINMGLNVFGDEKSPVSPHITINAGEMPDSLERLTFCVLVLENAFTVVGKSAPASASNFDAVLGRKIARQDAINQIWPLEGYLLREQLFAREPSPTERELIGGSVESDAVYRFGAWLTSRDEAVTASAKHDAAPMAQLVDQFLNQPKPPLGATTGVE